MKIDHSYKDSKRQYFALMFNFIKVFDKMYLCPDIITTMLSWEIFKSLYTLTEVYYDEKSNDFKIGSEEGPFCDWKEILRQVNDNRPILHKDGVGNLQTGKGEGSEESLQMGSGIGGKKDSFSD